MLYSFCAQGGLDRCTDGVGPAAGLIMDPSGNLYGTTEHGGVSAVPGAEAEAASAAARCSNWHPTQPLSDIRAITHDCSQSKSLCPAVEFTDLDPGLTASNALRWIDI